MELKKGYSRKLDNRFSIHIAGNIEEELNAILKFNNQLHSGEEIVDYIKSFLSEYPRNNEIYWIYIKDNKTGTIVSSLCLSPMEWQFENIELPVCEMEFVGTLESYRERGFIKTLNSLYDEIMERNGYVLSGIRGIPSFYRGLGYVYISSLDERVSISAFKIPNKVDTIKIRKAKSDDIHFIEVKYSEFHKKFSLFCKFNEECFTFKYLNDEFTTEVRSTYILEEGGVAKNYFSLGWTYDKKCYEIICPDLSNREVTALLEHVKKLGNYRDNDEIIISVNKHTSLFKYIRSLGGKPVSEYGWQVKIPNIKKYFLATPPSSKIYVDLTSVVNSPNL
ncbi:MAG: GNAT family N-acetyltransferase [Candidatus Lokiarchaeota archaeon]